jgi:two-component system nitrogen regulation response regulator NtrX
MAISGSVLVVDDEKNIRRTLNLVLEGEGYEVEQAQSGEDALKMFEAHRFDAVMLDVQMPGINGLETLRKIKEAEHDVEVVMMSGHATLADAVEATQLGAFDFLEKPLDRDRVLITLRNCMARRQLTIRVQALSGQKGDPFDMIGQSPGMQHLVREIEKVAPTRGRVLITGESGVGKELVARAIHRMSERRDKTFVRVNCAAIPHDLIESELFGHERGSFSGASQRKRGQFEIADGGTILLDEIGDMSLDAQAKVLRVLENKEMHRVGSERPMTVDVRVLAATNKNLEDEVKAGRFRQDLFFRLNVVPIHVPPLRERGEDVPLLVGAFLAEFCHEYGIRPVKQVAADAMAALQAYAWPGNIRELKNLCERLVIMGSQTIHLNDLPESIAPRSAALGAGVPQSGASFGSSVVAGSIRAALNIPTGSMSLKAFRHEVERAYITSTLKAHNWNVSKTAEVLGVERTNLHKKIKKYGIDREGRISE